MQNEKTLRQLLMQIDGRGYKAYKSIRGVYQFNQFTLFIDAVQGDPFAAPSRIRVRIPQNIAQYPPETFANASRKVGLENYLLLQLAAKIRQESARRGSGKSGLIAVDTPGQTMLTRTAMQVTAEFVEAHLSVGLPAQGRRVLGRQAAEMLCDALPRIVSQSLRHTANDPQQLAAYTAAAEDADTLRAQLAANGWVAFIADGAVLPRRSGVDDRPLTGKNVVAWQSPPSLRASVTLPHAGTITGTAVPQGVTLIVGGGFHGKSTLLAAIEQGVYNHHPGDGRELVVTDETAVKIRAEDGRSVAGVDISPFIANLPFGQPTTAFTTENASGSTSQAANIMEAINLGARLLLVDEDTAATNFMIRDHRMQALIAKEKEPITPFIDRVRQLYTEKGISTLLVIGGSGDYFDVADYVLAMDSYNPYDVTEKAHQIAQNMQTGRVAEGSSRIQWHDRRVPIATSVSARKGRRNVHVKTRGKETILFGEAQIDLGALSQLVDAGQTRAIADALAYAQERYMDGKRPITHIIQQVMADIAQNGLSCLSRRPGPDYAQFRPHELGATLNRLRTLKVKVS